mgnify:FL=1
MRRSFYFFVYWLLGKIVRPTANFSHELSLDREILFVLQYRSLTELFVLGLIAEKQGLPSPFSELRSEGWVISQRVFALLRPTGGRMLVKDYSERFVKSINAPAEAKRNIVLVPVSFFWGRSLAPNRSWSKTFMNERGQTTGKLKKLWSILFHRTDIHVRFGEPLSLERLADLKAGENIALRRTARLLRTKFKLQREATLGPNFTDRKQFIEELANSRRVREEIAQLAQTEKSRMKKRLRAFQISNTVVANMSHMKLRIFYRILSWFWNKIYDGLEITGVNEVMVTSESHTLVYVPSHRSHIDYMALSYSLYKAGLMTPHIAAGDNLNLPMLGNFLRGSGAFFMRRSFREDPLYSAIFSEYIHRLLYKGHCIEFFPEGGRSRTGRLLKAKYGLLKLCLESQLTQLPKPIAFVPVYFGYEKILEANIYVEQLKGIKKKTEKLLDILSALKFVRNYYGRLSVNLGNPIELDSWLEAREDRKSIRSFDATLIALGNHLMQSINKKAIANDVNFCATILLNTRANSMSLEEYERHTVFFRDLLIKVNGNSSTTTTLTSNQMVIDRLVKLEFIDISSQETGTIISLKESALQSAHWYQNNTIHLFLPTAVIAFLLTRRKTGITVQSLRAISRRVYRSLYDAPSEESSMQIKNSLKLLDSSEALSVKDGRLWPPNRKNPGYSELKILSHLVEPMIEELFIILSLASTRQFNELHLRDKTESILSYLRELRKTSIVTNLTQGLAEEFIEKAISSSLIRVTEDKSIVAGRVAKLAIALFEPLMDEDIIEILSKQTN